MNRTIYSYFKETADIYPENPAIIEDNRTLTFSQLDRMVDAIAAKRVEPEDVEAMPVVMKEGGV